MPPAKSASGPVGHDGARPPRPHDTWLRLALLFLAGAVVYAPAMHARYFLDDYVQASMVRGTYPAPRSPWNLYDFINDADRGALLERGILPWWADPQLSMRFLRPLSSLLLWTERTLLGDSPRVFHLHSLLWWAAAVLGARALLHRLLPQRPARFATVVFALAPCHALPLAWLANREALVSLAFGLWALGAYLRWRERGAVREGLLAAALFTLSLLGGEYAFCFAGYVVALEMAAPRALVTIGGAPPARLLGLMPFALPASAYLAVRSALGYGARGSGFYADPFREPAVFFAWAPRRVATLLLEGWLSLDHDTLLMDTSWWVLGAAFLAALALLAVPLRRTLERLDEAPRRSAEWLLLGSVLAVVPVTAVISSPRLLGASMLGVAACVGLLLDQAWFPGIVRSGSREHLAAAAVVLGFAHLVHGPVTSWLTARRFHQQAASFADHAAELGGRIAGAEGVEVVVMRGLAGSFFLPWLDDHGLGTARFRILSQTGHLLALRVDERTLDLVAPPSVGIFPPAGAANLFRNEKHRMAVGDVVAVPGLRATVLELGAEVPRRVRFELDRDLDSDALEWISEDRGGAFLATPPPAEGFGAPFDP